jgi:hypothetical protein
MNIPLDEALEHLFNYYQEELGLIRDFQDWKSKLKTDSEYEPSFKNALHYFYTLWWVRPERVPGLMTRTLQWVHGETPDDVDEFAESLSGYLGSKETSLASEILFLNNPQKITPITAGVKEAVNKLKADNYRVYRRRFEKFQKENINKIRQNLDKIADRLLKAEREFGDQPQIDFERLRLDRYTDQLLRRKGIESLDRPNAPADPATAEFERERTRIYINPARIDDLKTIKPILYDTSKLVALCEELNFCYDKTYFYGVMMILRAIEDHVLPLFGDTNKYEPEERFKKIMSDYHGGSEQFNQSVHDLITRARPISNAALHSEIGEREIRFTRGDTMFVAQLDDYLQEVAKLLRSKSFPTASTQ